MENRYDRSNNELLRCIKVNTTKDPNGIIDTSSLAKESTLLDILNVLQEIEVNTEDTVTELQSVNVNLGNIEIDTSAIESGLSDLITEVENGNTINATNLSNLLTSSNNIVNAINNSNTNLSNLISAVQTADINNINAISALQTSLSSDLVDLLTELQAININTDGLEAGQTTITAAINNNTTLTVDELQDIETILTTISTDVSDIEVILGSQQLILSNILSAIQLADSNNTTDLSDLQTALQTDLASLLVQLTAININTDGLEAGQTTITAAINNNTTLTVDELQDIEALVTSSLSELQSIDSTLTTQQTVLSNIITEIQSASSDIVAAITTLQTTLQTDLGTIITSLNTIDSNTDGLEAGQTTITAAINNNTTLTVDELQDIETILVNSLNEHTNTVTQLTNANTTLTSILNGLTGVQGLITSRSRTTGVNTYTAPFRSISITAISNDVTIDGQSVPKGFSESVESNEKEQHTVNVTVTGTDYYVTLVRNV